MTVTGAVKAPAWAILSKGEKREVGVGIPVADQFGGIGRSRAFGFMRQNAETEIGILLFGERNDFAAGGQQKAGDQETDKGNFLCFHQKGIPFFWIFPFIITDFVRNCKHFFRKGQEFPFFF